MIIETVSGDLLKLFAEGKFDAIVQGCNCYHTQGAGLAGQISRKYPEVLEADRATLKGPEKLGKFSVARIQLNEKDTFAYIINMYTQDQPGRESQQVLSESIRKGFTTLNTELSNLRSESRALVGIPQLGAGIAGGTWSIHEALINAVTPDIDLVLVNYKP
jgi:O-acetyl-ADP-ribose deacetylase (regulator of RNase III)